MHLQQSMPIAVRNNKATQLPKATEQKSKSIELIEYFNRQAVDQTISNKSANSDTRSDKSSIIAISTDTSFRPVEKAVTSTTTNNSAPINLANQQKKQSLFTGFQKLVTKGFEAIAKSVESAWNLIGNKLTGMFKANPAKIVEQHTSISQSEGVEMDDEIIENSIDKLLPKIEQLTQEKDAIKISKATNLEGIEEAIELFKKKQNIAKEILKLTSLAIENFDANKSQGKTRIDLNYYKLQTNNYILKTSNYIQSLEMRAKSAAAA